MFVTQMKIIHGGSYSIDELNSFISTIHGNLLTSMVEVIKAMDKLNITLHNPSNQIVPLRLPIVQYHCSIFQQKLVKWSYCGRMKCAVEYQLSDSAPHYFQRMNGISPRSIFYTQWTGCATITCIYTNHWMAETTFTSGNITYWLFDVVGQYLQQQKWFHYFDRVKTTLFVAAISGYDMILTEDDTTNRKEESLNLFQVCMSWHS